MIIEQKDSKMFRVINPDEHDSNKIYLSYFYVGSMTKEQEVALSVMIYYFREWIYNQLREKRNLGYVASAFSRSFYYNKGIVVLLDGENFVPQNIEEDIEKVIGEFLEDFKKVGTRERKQTATTIWEDELLLRGQLNHVAEGIWDEYERDQIIHDNQDYTYVVNHFDTDLPQQMIEKYLILNKKRFILEMSNGEEYVKKMNYILDKKFTLNKEQYQLGNIDEFLDSNDHKLIW